MADKLEADGETIQWNCTLSKLEGNIINNDEPVNTVFYLLTQINNNNNDNDNSNNNNNNNNNNRELKLDITNGVHLWRGNMKENSMSDYADKLKFTSVNEYLLITKDSLTYVSDHSINNNDVAYEYELRRDFNDKITFTWKRLRSTGIKVHYGSVELKLIKDVHTKSPILQFLNHSLLEMKQRDNKISELHSQKEDLIKQRQDALLLANTAVANKDEYESDIIQSFTAALNKKKQKVNELKEELEIMKKIRSQEILRGSDTDTDNEQSLVTLDETHPNDSKVVESLSQKSPKTGRQAKKDAGSLLKSRLDADTVNNNELGPPLKKRTRVVKENIRHVTKSPPPVYTPTKNSGSLRGRAKNKRQISNADDLIQDM